jgi:manganese transport protein
MSEPPFVSANHAGWRGDRSGDSSSGLPELLGRVAIPHGNSRLRKLLAFTGPGLMVAVGYVDPGNWATDLAGGARFGYTLLSVILVSNLIAILVQYLSLKLGIATGRDLAQSCRDHYSRPVNLTLWGLCEIAIAACDLAEVIGSAIALNLLFGLPLLAGVLLTSLDVMLILFFQHKGFRMTEALVATLLLVIAGCFGFELLVSKPDWWGVARGLIPATSIVRDPSSLYIAVGILGATVMPHNLYLHSSLVQTRGYARDPAGKKMAIRYASLDSSISLVFAFFINAAILVLAAAAFHGTRYSNVADISDAYRLLSPVLGVPLASTLFAVALLASGQNSTLTGTLAGQIVMEGFLNLRMRPWLRRILTRLLAIVPAVIVIAFWGEREIPKLLVLSQVVLSFQLSFAVLPLVIFTSDKSKMQGFQNSRVTKLAAWVSALAIAGLNLWLLVQFATGA